MVKLSGVICFIAILFLVTGSIFAGIVNMTQAGYEWNYNVHGHMENAYYADEPQLMKSELLLAIQGMEDLGLTRDKYGAFFAWDKTPDKRMSYQYDHLYGIVDRIDSVIIWYEHNYGENASGGTEALGDVFEEKMDNLRAFLMEDGWSDWIGCDAFYIEHYLWIHLWWIWVAILNIIIILSGFVAIVGGI